MAPTKPSLELLRSLSDEHVLRALMEQRQATRAELAVATGLSKPTVSESVRRLSAAGVVVDTGERTTGRGRVGTYYGLPATTGCALVVGIAPEGIVAEAVDVHGEVVARSHAEARDVTATLRRVAGEVAGRCAGPVRVAVVSVADPVDRETGRLVELPDAPFLVGELDAPAVLAELVDGPVTVDNDVNWMARAEDGSDFVYVYLGEGVGCAVVSDGEVLRGHAGLAGEIAHVVTVGPGGRAMRLTEVFEALGLRRPGSTAIDVPALLRAVDDAGPPPSWRGRWPGCCRRPSRWPIRRSCSSAVRGVAIRACSPRSRASSPARRATSRSSRRGRRRAGAGRSPRGGAATAARRDRRRRPHLTQARSTTPERSGRAARWWSASSP